MEKFSTNTPIVEQSQGNVIMRTLSVEYLRQRIQNTHPRTRKAQFNTLVGLTVKGGGMLISLLLVPLTIDYLSKSTYGTWLTISSIVTMVALFDIGIGNGLRNRFSEAVSKQDHVLARAYVSTAYLVFGVFQLGFIILFVLIFKYIPWSAILNTKIDNDQLQVVVLLTAVAVSIKLVLDILSYVLFALQESGRVSLINFMSNALILIGTYTLTRFTTGNLISLAIVTACSPILILIVSGFVLYRSYLRAYRPAWQFTDLKYAKNLLSLGYKFFIIQMAVIVIFYTDNLIITQLFGPAEVTTYNVAFRYFNAINTIFTIAITPYWSAFTEAFANNELAWMKKTYRYLQRLWLGLILIVVLMTIASNTVYTVWVGNRVEVPLTLSICTGIFTIVSCWNSVAVAVANGVGKVRLQLYYSLASALINIPLAILLGRTLHLGSAGVILATSTSLLFGSIIGGLQAGKILSNNAKGIWNQ